jgi:dihydrofolate reductase
MLHSVEEIIEKYQNAEEEVFIIGGSHLYQALLPFAKKLYLTQVHQSFEADVYFPKLNLEEWEVESKERHEASEKNAYAFSFVNLIRR